MKTLQKNKRKIVGGLATGVALATTQANAAVLDVQPLMADITGNSTSLQTGMLAVLGLSVMFVGFKFLKRLFS